MKISSSSSSFKSSVINFASVFNSSGYIMILFQNVAVILLASNLL